MRRHERALTVITDVIEEFAEFMAPVLVYGGAVYLAAQIVRAIWFLP